MVTTATSSLLRGTATPLARGGVAYARQDMPATDRPDPQVLLTAPAGYAAKPGTPAASYLWQPPAVGTLLDTYA